MPTKIILQNKYRMLELSSYVFGGLCMNKINY